MGEEGELLEDDTDITLVCRNGVSFIACGDAFSVQPNQPRIRPFNRFGRISTTAEEIIDTLGK